MYSLRRQSTILITVLLLLITILTLRTKLANSTMVTFSSVILFVNKEAMTKSHVVDSFVVCASRRRNIKIFRVSAHHKELAEI